MQYAFSNKALESEYKPTIGVEFITIGYKWKEKKSYKMQIWETAGQDRYRAILSAFYRAARCFFFFFALDEPSSFESMKTTFNEWLGSHTGCTGIDSLHSHLRDSNQTLIIIGTKSDLERKVLTTDISKFLHEIVPITSTGIPLSELRVQYFEISCVKNTSLEATLPFVYAASTIPPIIRKQVPDRVVLHTEPQVCK